MGPPYRFLIFISNYNNNNNNNKQFIFFMGKIGQRRIKVIMHKIKIALLKMQNITSLIT